MDWLLQPVQTLDYTQVRLAGAKDISKPPIQSAIPDSTLLKLFSPQKKEQINT